jgi:hypothetical protein
MRELLKYLLIVTFIGLYVNISAQYIVNNNAKVHIKSGTTFLFTDLKNIGAEASFNINAPLSLSGDFENSGAASFTQNPAVVITFNGLELQNITSGGCVFAKAVISNSTGNNSEILLHDNMSISGTLTLTDGVINTGANRVLFGSSVAIEGGSSNSFIDGEMQFEGSGSFKFPCGDVISRDLDNNGFDEEYSIYSPITFAPTSGSPTTVVEYNYDEPIHDWWEHGGNMDLNLDHVSSREWWDVNSTGNIGLLKLEYIDNIHVPGEPCPHGVCNGDIPSNFQSSDLSVAVWNNTNGWIDLGQGSFVGNHDAGAITSALVPPVESKSKAGQYIITIGSKTPYTPLPVELLSFFAECNSDYVSLSWATASEVNNDRFVIERSSDLRNFIAIESVFGQGNTTIYQEYSFFDYEPIRKAYYRLKQVDFDGTYAYSNVVAVECSGNVDADAPLVELYPNPAKDILHIVGEGLPELTSEIVVMDVLGKVVFETQVESYAIGFHKEIDVSSLNPAMYFVKVYSGTFSETYKIDKEQ